MCNDYLRGVLTRNARFEQMTVCNLSNLYTPKM